VGCLWPSGCRPSQLWARRKKPSRQPVNKVKKPRVQGSKQCIRRPGPPLLAAPPPLARCTAARPDRRSPGAPDAEPDPESQDHCSPARRDGRARQPLLPGRLESVTARWTPGVRDRSLDARMASSSTPKTIFVLSMLMKL
jgi:hypothetical protein